VRSRTRRSVFPLWQPARVRLQKRGGVKAMGAMALLPICDTSFTCEDYNTYMAHPWSPFPLRRDIQDPVLTGGGLRLPWKLGSFRVEDGGV